MTHSHQHQEVDKPENLSETTLLLRTACLKCEGGELSLSYCCPKQAFMRCSCSKIDTKIPIEHVEHLGRAIPALLASRSAKKS